MKRILFKISSFILLLVLSLSAVGCSLFNVYNGTIENLPSSSEKLGNVVYGTNTGERVKKSNTELVEMVTGSVVAVAVEEEGGYVAYGSGVIADIDVEGVNALGDSEVYLLTCHHVIANMGTINIFLPDAEGDNWGESDYNKKDYMFAGVIGSKGYAVTLVGGDSVSDIAVLKINLAGSKVDKEDVTMAKFPSSNYSFKVGEEVCAIGNPTGMLPGTVSFGTISYINRETTFSDLGDMTLLQLNVDIYHGSSGGALFNMYGELIGITNGGNDKYSGINYAIPFIIDATQGALDKGFLSVSGQLIATATEKNYGYVSGRICKFGFDASTQSSSVVINSVNSGSLAYKAGLQASDVILKAKKNATSEQDLRNSPDITSSEQLTSVFKDLVVGDKVSLLVERGSVFNRKTIMITMSAIQYIFCDTGIYPSV